MSLTPFRAFVIKEIRHTVALLVILATVLCALAGWSNSHPVTQLATLLTGAGCGLLCKRLYGEFEWHRSNPTG